MCFVALFTYPLFIWNGIQSQDYQGNTGIVENKHEAIVQFGFSSKTEYYFLLNVSDSMILYEVDQKDYLQYNLGDKYQFTIGSYTDRENWDILNPNY